MRTELELIQKIEAWLDGSMSAEEQRLFEENMLRDAHLLGEVRLQQEIMNGIENAALRQKIQQTGRLRRRRRNLRNWGGAGLAVILLTAAIFLIAKQHVPATPTSAPPNIPAKSQAPIYSGATTHDTIIPTNTGFTLSIPNTQPDSNEQRVRTKNTIPLQSFHINTNADTVIETKGGIILSIPASSFLDSSGQPVTGPIDFVIHEALDPASIIKAGLSTRSGDQLLETGGMFYVDAVQDGRTLKIDPSRSIYAQVPANQYQPDMQLFTGRRLADGTIDWQDPRPLEHYLNTVDIHQLNFYPPHYLDSVRSWGYNADDRQFTDSLYFSFAGLSSQAAAPVRSSPVAAQPRPVDYTQRDTIILDSSIGPRYDCDIDPARIKAIWNDSFRNTLLATREFEQRMTYIHMAGPKILDLYVQNLDKNLSTIDSMTAASPYISGQLKGEIFPSFARRRDGKVPLGIQQLQKLNIYYIQKTQAFATAVARTQKEFWDHEALLDKKYTDHTIDSIERTSRNFQQELDINFREACRQLGYTIAPARPTPSVYQVKLPATGWFNLDKYVRTATEGRTTLNVTDPQTGKKTVIQYLPASFHPARWKDYDRLYVYLLPDRLSSYMRLTSANGSYPEKLNVLLSYDLVCIGYKGGQAFFYSKPKVQAGDHSFGLQPIDSATLDIQLKKWGNQSQSAGLLRENAFDRWRQQDRPRLQRNERLRDLRDKMERAFFSKCLFWGEAEPQ